MTWTIILENENKKPIATIENGFYSAAISDKNKNFTFQLLQYLNPYGDTVFNSLQMKDLISDLQLLEKHAPTSFTHEIIALATRCENEAHTYLVFYGE